MQDLVACIHHNTGTYACKSWVSWTTHSSINNQPAAFWKGRFLEGGMEEIPCTNTLCGYVNHL